MQLRSRPGVSDKSHAHITNLERHDLRPALRARAANRRMGPIQAAQHGLDAGEDSAAGPVQYGRWRRVDFDAADRAAGGDVRAQRTDARLRRPAAAEADA